MVTMADRADDLGASYLTMSYGVENHAAAAMLAATGLVIARRGGSMTRWPVPTVTPTRLSAHH